MDADVTEHRTASEPLILLSVWHIALRVFLLLLVAAKKFGSVRLYTYSTWSIALASGMMSQRTTKMYNVFFYIDGRMDGLLSRMTDGFLVLCFPFSGYGGGHIENLGKNALRWNVNYNFRIWIHATTYFNWKKNYVNMQPEKKIKRHTVWWRRLVIFSKFILFYFIFILLFARPRWVTAIVLTDYSITIIHEGVGSLCVI